jgi:hypothetical protein
VRVFSPATPLPTQCQSLLLIEMRKVLGDKQVEGLNSFITGIEGRKAALAEEESG